MGKDPAYLFYYQDFEHGTRRFNFEEKGVYITLLNEQADSPTGSITKENIHNICSSCDADMINKVLSKFKQDRNGFYNEVQRTHLEKRRKFCKSRANNRLGKTKGDNTSLTSVPHMEDVNVIVIKDDLKKNDNLDIEQIKKDHIDNYMKNTGESNVKKDE